MRKFIKNWLFKEELEKFEKETGKLNALVSCAEKKLDEVGKLQRTFTELLKDIDVSVDVHEYRGTPSWAVISLQGEKTDYIKFIELSNGDIKEISRFLSQFERSRNIKIDASPVTSQFLRVKKYY